ncbi:ribonuclease H-like domain-containing protein [Tanacetum coccineum]
MRKSDHNSNDGLVSDVAMKSCFELMKQIMLARPSESYRWLIVAPSPYLKQLNGNSFKPAAKTTTNADGTSTKLIPGLVTTEEKVQKKNDMKARSMLLMVLPNEHLMTFNQYKDAKTLFAAIQTRFGGNEAIKKTQKTLLKQMYENFSAPSTESLYSIFNRLQKIVSQLAILGENISQEDLNLKFLRSLPFKWNTRVVVWRNKLDLHTMSFDDLYNNFMIVEQEVKGTASSSSSSNAQNMAFVSSPSSTNEVNTAYGVSSANTQISPTSTQFSTASTQVGTANLSDEIVYAFLASQPNGSQLVYEDHEKIHEDDIEEMDLKWQLALLSMRTRRECRGTRNQDSMNGNQDSSRRIVNVKETSSKAMLAIDVAGFDWSYMADDEVPTNMALMTFLDFEFNLANYKRGLASVEKQLVFYKKNVVIFYEQLVVLKRDISYKDSEISMLKSELEKLKQEKESNQLKIKNFDNASKSLDKLIRSQKPDKSRKGLGFVSYNVVPPPPTGLFSPPNLDLSNSGLEEFQQPEFKGYGPKTSKSINEDISNEVRESPDAPLVKELVLDDKFDHVHANCNYNQRERIVSGNNNTRVNYNYSTKKAHPSAHRNMAPRAVLMKTGLRPLNTARPINIAHPKTIVYCARPMPKAVNTARPNSAVVNVVRANQDASNIEILTVLDIAYHAILTILDIVYHAMLTVLNIIYHAILTDLDIVYHAILTVLNMLYHAILTVLDIEINEIMPPRKAPRTRTTLATTTTTTYVTNAQLQVMIDQGVTDALAARDAKRNGDDSHTSGMGVRRTERVAREYTYQYFMKCQPLYFKGTEGVELALLCVRMFLKESEKVERYVGGLPDMIHGNVAASKPKTMQEATEMVTELMDKKISTLAERQAENKRKLDNNNQAQQQSPKRQNVARAYAAGTGERKEYVGTLLLCNRCKLHHNGPCTVKCANCKRVGHMTRDCRSPTATNNQRNPTSDCPKRRNQSHENQTRGTRAHGVVHALGGGETDQDPNKIEDEIEA